MLFFALLSQLFSPSYRIATPCGDVPPGMSCVPGGWFIRGANDRRRDQRSQAKIYVDTFWIDRYEVTAGEYDRCVRHGRCAYQKTNYDHFCDEDQPKVGLSWYAARNYCRVHLGDLPTESQWEKAARGPDGDLYPWGNAPVTCELAVIKNAKGRGCGRKAVSREKGRTSNVGSRRAYRYGLYDMIGNTDEYVLDWYSESYDHCGALCFGENPRGPCNGDEHCPGYKERVVRGGSWYWGAAHAYGSYRRGHFPSQKRIYHHFGFRCARAVASPHAEVASLVNSVVGPSARLGAKVAGSFLKCF